MKIKVLIRAFYTFYVISILTGCVSSKIYNLFDDGSYKSEVLSDSIPISFRLGLSIINVKINGESFDFMVDTGAPNIISESLAEKLNLPLLGTSQASDIHGATEELEIVRLDTVTIGVSDFINTVALVSNLKNGPLGCLDIDGIIGSNLMRHAIWDFDFPKSLLRINAEATLVDTNNKNKYQSKIFVGVDGTPAIISKLNGMKVLNTTIDLGSNGGVEFSLKEYYKAKSKKLIEDENKGIGSSTYGIFSLGESESSYETNVKRLTIGDLELADQLVSFEGTRGKEIGMDFWKDYRLIINWFDRKLTLIPSLEKAEVKDNTQGFGLIWSNNNLYVSSLLIGSVFEKAGLELGDRIISINDADYSEVSLEDYCKFLANDFGLSDIEELSFEVIGGNGERRKIEIR
ncbi:MAG: aspartyl protease family protein [Bacteroidota bacterium]